MRMPPACCPPRTRTSGLAPLEAMAFGRPVAVLRAGGFLETVVEGETGVFFDRPEPADVVARRAPAPGPRTSTSTASQSTPGASTRRALPVRSVILPTRRWPEARGPAVSSDPHVKSRAVESTGRSASGPAPADEVCDAGSADTAARSWERREQRYHRRHSAEVGASLRHSHLRHHHGIA